MLCVPTARAFPNTCTYRLFSRDWRGESLVLVSVSAGKPSGINNELLTTNNSFIFYLRFAVNAEKKIMRCVSVYVIG